MTKQNVFFIAVIRDWHIIGHQVHSVNFNCTQSEEIQGKLGIVGFYRRSYTENKTQNDFCCLQNVVTW